MNRIPPQKQKREKVLKKKKFV